MDNLRELQRQHQIFVEEVFTFLLVNSKIESKYLSEYRIFRPYIGDAIVTISHIFRKDYRKIFCRLRKNLKHIKMFERYCMIVPVKKDERYFYYILMRMSVIFELSLYCHYEGYDYFKKGKKCMAEYEDLLYFESAGGWGKLAHTALFIASLGRPLTLLMYYNYNESGEIIQTFDEAFSTLYKNFILTANFDMMDSAEIFCLMELNKVFRTQFPEGEVKTGKKAKIQNKNKLPEDLAVFPKTSFYYCKGASCILIAEYFKKCFQDLISSKALGYLINNFDYENLLDAFDLKTIIDVEEFEGFSDLENSAHLNADFTGMKVNYIELYKTCSPVVSPETIGEFLVDEELRADLNISEDSSVLDASHLNSSLHSPGNIRVKTPLSQKESPEKYLTFKSTATSENLNQNYNYNKLDENIASRKDLIINPTFIVPNKYLHLTNAADVSKNMQLYTAKMWPPSKRKKLSERLKKLLDQNIENQNYSMLPSGDILVRRFESSVNNDTLIILAESCSDDEIDDDADTLICLFKKMELDSLGNEKGYSLRSRQPRLPKKDRSGTDLDGEKPRKIMASDEGYPLNIPRTVKSKRVTSIADEKLYAKKLINLYKKYFTSFLDKYFNTEFYALLTEQCIKEPVSNEDNEDINNSEITEDVNNSKINQDCTYVFAATASLMAKRKVLLDEPDEKKRVFGLQLYNITFQPMILPLEVQRELDLQIRKGNYFAAPNGVYGVGPKNSVPRENVWAIFFSGNGQQADFIEYKKEDLKEIPNIFRSYEPVLETFLPLPEDNVKIAVDCIQYLLRDYANGGFNLKLLTNEN